jgi:AcrR family transcriptional regulator
MTARSDKNLRSQILLAARDLFIQHGYRGLPMREIAEAVGVSKPALYYHFHDKEELFLAVLYQALDELEALVAQAYAAAQAEGNLEQALRGLVGEIIARPAGERTVIRLASQEMDHLSEAGRQALVGLYQEKFLGGLESLIQAGVARGELRPLHPTTAAWALLGLMYPFLSNPALLESRSPPDLAAEITQIFLSGVKRQT